MNLYLHFLMYTFWLSSYATRLSACGVEEKSKWQGLADILAQDVFCSLRVSG